MDLISVIIPAFNAQSYVRQAVESALNQTYPDQEVIVVDDGSTDGTPGILAEYAGRIRVVSQANQGTARACNAGVHAARGTWIAFLDADDVWLAQKSQRQLAACGQYAISHTDSVCFGETIDGEIRRSSFEPPHAGKVLPELLVRNFITKSAVMMLKSTFEESGGFGDTHAAVEDWPLWLRICARHELGYVPEVLLRYRVHRQSKSMRIRETLGTHRRIIEEAFAADGVGAALPHLRRRALASSYEINCHFATEVGDFRFARRCALGALVQQPASVYAWKTMARTLLAPLRPAS